MRFNVYFTPSHRHKPKLSDARREYFGIVARMIKGKGDLRRKGYVVFDLDDF